MPVTTRSKLKEPDREVVRGTITRLAPQPEGRFAMTIDIGHTSPVILNSKWSNQAPEVLAEGQEVRLEGRIQRINRSVSDAKWDTATLKLDGYAYRVNLLTSAAKKA